MENERCLRVFTSCLRETLPNTKPGKFKLKQHLSQPPLSEFPPKMIYAVAKEMNTRRLISIAPPTSSHPGASIDVVPPADYVILSMTKEGLDFADKLNDSKVWEKLSPILSAAGKITFEEFLRIVISLFMGQVLT